jgi:hypothetical protein
VAIEVSLTLLSIAFPELFLTMIVLMSIGILGGMLIEHAMRRAGHQ